MAKKDEKESKELATPAPAHPARNLASPFDELEHLFDEFLTRGGWLQPFLRRSLSELEAPFGSRSPRVDVIDRDDEVIIKAELPGVDKDKLDVSINDTLLTIRARAEHEKKDEKGHYFRRELTRGEFQRTIRLPGAVDGEKAQASFSHGILEISVPKLASSKRQKIKID